MKKIIIAIIVLVLVIIVLIPITRRIISSFYVYDVLIKGGDYKPSEIVGYDIVKSSGGKITTIEFIDGFSTTSIIEKLRKQDG